MEATAAPAGTSSVPVRAGKRVRHPPSHFGEEADDGDIEFYGGAESGGGSLSEDYDEHDVPAGARSAGSGGGPRKRSNRKVPNGSAGTASMGAVEDAAGGDDVPSALRRRAQVRDASRRFRERKKAEMGALEDRVAALTSELTLVRAQLQRAQAGGTSGADDVVAAQQQRIVELEAALAARDAAPRGGSDRSRSRKQTVSLDTTEQSSAELLEAQNTVQSLLGTLRAVAEETTVNPALAAAMPRRLMEVIRSQAWSQLSSSPESPPGLATFGNFAAPGMYGMPRHAVPPLPLQFTGPPTYPALGSMTMRDMMLTTGSRGDGAGMPHMFPMYMSNPHLAAMSAARQSQASPMPMHGMPHTLAQPAAPVPAPAPYTVISPVPPEFSHLIARAMVDICAFANDDWKVEVRTPDLTVFSRPADLPVFSIKTAQVVADIPPAILAEAVWRNFTDEATARRVTPDTVQRCAVMETYAPDTSLIYRSEHFTFPTHSRDFVYLAHRLDGCTLGTVRGFAAPTVLPPPTPFDAPGSTASDGDLMWLGIMRSVQHPGLPVTEPTVVRADLYEGYIVRAGPGGRGSILITIGQIDTKHGLASIPEEHLRATFESVPGYVGNLITAARELADAAVASPPPPAPMQTFSLLAGAPWRAQVPPCTCLPPPSRTARTRWPCLLCAINPSFLCILCLTRDVQLACVACALSSLSALASV